MISYAVAFFVLAITMMKKSDKIKNSRFTLGIMILTTALIFAPMLTANLPRSKLKPYATMDEFYTFYLTQHEEICCRRLHIVGTTLIAIIAFLDWDIIVSIIFAALAGRVGHLLTLSIDTGFVEFAIMFIAYLWSIKEIGGNIKRALLVPTIAYSFSWIGHCFRKQ